MIGTRVSYEDMANPRREGTIVGEVAGQWAVRWDEYEAVYNLVEQDGIWFHDTVTKAMLARHASRRGAGWGIIPCECPANPAGPWDCLDCPAHGDEADRAVARQAQSEIDAENGWLRAAENAMEDCPEWAR